MYSTNYHRDAGTAGTYLLFSFTTDLSEPLSSQASSGTGALFFGAQE